MSDLLWMGGLALAVVVFLILVRRWSYNIAIDLECDGRIYRAHRGGHFTDRHPHRRPGSSGQTRFVRGVGEARAIPGDGFAASIGH